MEAEWGAAGGWGLALLLLMCARKGRAGRILLQEDEVCCGRRRRARAQVAKLESKSKSTTAIHPPSPPSVADDATQEGELRKLSSRSGSSGSFPLDRDSHLQISFLRRLRRSSARLIRHEHRHPSETQLRRSSSNPSKLRRSSSKLPSSQLSGPRESSSARLRRVETQSPESKESTIVPVAA